MFHRFGTTQERSIQENWALRDGAFRANDVAALRPQPILLYSQVLVGGADAGVADACHGCNLNA